MCSQQAQSSCVCIALLDEPFCAGHDDTVWMVENTLKLLRGLDHDQPYLITDNIWFDENGA